MSNVTLGLDLGTNSIGWALIEFDGTQRPQRLINCGVRIFQEAVDLKTRTPKNQKRRAARAARRLVSRRRRRRAKLTNLLVRQGLLPKEAQDSQQLEVLYNTLGNPYLLRKKGLDEALTLQELGRAISHLAHRRGFLSNRKTASKEDGKVKTAITQLDQAIRSQGCRTLGEYLAGERDQRRRYTSRAMYEYEFELLWRTQQKYHPKTLISAFKTSVYNTIFHQRPLKLQKFLVGNCTFEPNRHRAAKAWPDAQRFRMLQDLNHLQIKDPIKRTWRDLVPDERQKLLSLLEKQQTLSWDRARTLLGLHGGEQFNLEEGRKSELIGNRTAYRLRKILGKQWDELTPTHQNDLVTDLLTIDNEAGFLNRAKTYWVHDDTTAETLAMTELEPGYMRLSLKAIRRILPFLERGLTYDKACAAAGYNHSDPLRMTATDKLAPPPPLRNPVVQKALHETRKVVNAIVRKYGKPSSIRVEMARDMKLTRRQREEVMKQQNIQKKANDRARMILIDDFGIANPSRSDIQKYNLWKECKETCPYTGTPISPAMLFSSDVDVEHILPYGQSLDDSYMNKTLCMAEENRKVKHNRSPHEAYHADEIKFLEILQRIQALPWPKRRRFDQKEIKTDEFISRQLNDTRYICREVKGYLDQLGADVGITKGEATAALRRRWNLNQILAVDKLLEKNRTDHRHHAIDAVVIALTDRSLFQKLSRLSAQSGVALSERGLALDEPWPNFYRDIEIRIGNLVVSHAPSRKISDALHDATAYGYNERDKCFVYRIPLNGSISLSEIGKIRDKKVKDLVEARLREYNENIRKAFGNADSPLLHADGKTPIRSVRISVNSDPNTMLGIRDKKQVPYKFFKFANNHHVEILESVETNKRQCRFVSAFEAARRVRRDSDSIVNQSTEPGWRFVMSLGVNDYVEVESAGKLELYRVQKMSSGKQVELTLKRLNDALTDTNDQTLRIRNENATTAIVRKLSVDPIGCVFASNG